jgi:hypothetical protein
MEESVKFTGSDYPEAFDLFHQRFLEWGWSDGFPLVPPTEEKVKWMLSGTRHSPEKIVTLMDPDKGKATVEKIAVNAVMAGAIALS